MAEADPHHLAVLRGADEIQQLRDPRKRVVDAGRGAREQNGIECARVRRNFACLDVERLDLEARSEHLLEHRRIIAEPFGKPSGRAACLEDRELHGRCLATSFGFGQCVW